jgi:predicted RNA-binding protein with TRAM domain
MSYSGNRGYGGGGGRGYGGGSRGGYGGGGFGGPKPVEAGKEYNVQISEISRQGDGIARIQGFVIFVKGAKVGQKTKIKVTNVGPRFATAEISDGGSAAQGEATSQRVEVKPKDIAPAVTEDEKPTVQDYKATEQGEKLE